MNMRGIEKISGMMNRRSSPRPGPDPSLPNVASMPNVPPQTVKYMIPTSGASVRPRLSLWLSLVMSSAAVGAMESAMLETPSSRHGVPAGIPDGRRT